MKSKAMPAPTLIRNTKSICPVCYCIINAKIYGENRAVYIEKRCAEHGTFKDLCWSDYQLYREFEAKDIERGRKKTLKGKNTVVSISNEKKYEGCPFDCGLCPQHLSSTIFGIIDVTKRCNLQCPICFADGGNDDKKEDGREKKLETEEIKKIIDNFAENTNVLGLQFSGGEPTLREDLPELISYARKKFHHVEVNTNGIKMASSKNYCKELESAGTSVIYLQFDGVTAEPYKKLRGKNLLDVKKKAIENHRTSGPKPAIVLVPTIAKGINDSQIGGIIRFAIANKDIVRGVNFQPVSFCGRTVYDRSRRITIPDVLQKIEEQTDFLQKNNFFPPSLLNVMLEAIGKKKMSCHFSCGAFTYLVVEGEEKVVPLIKYVNIERLKEAYIKKGGISISDTLRSVHIRILYKSALSFIKSRSYSKLSDFHFNLLFIGAMHFMDAYNFDFERVRRCVIHYGLKDGSVVPFCSYNTIHRAMATI